MALMSSEKEKEIDTVLTQIRKKKYGSSGAVHATFYNPTIYIGEEKAVLYKLLREDENAKYILQSKLIDGNYKDVAYFIAEILWGRKETELLKEAYIRAEGETKEYILHATPIEELDKEELDLLENLIKLSTNEPELESVSKDILSKIEDRKFKLLKEKAITRGGTTPRPPVDDIEFYDGGPGPGIVMPPIEVEARRRIKKELDLLINSNRIDKFDSIVDFLPHVLDCPGIISEIEKGKGILHQIARLNTDPERANHDWKALEK